MAEPASKSDIDFITNSLTELAAHVSLRGSMNLTDIHVVSEDFYAGLLNIAYGWHLKNANTVHPNVEGIDLVDDEARVIVQVSATCSKKKIDHSLHGIDAAFRGYHFYFFPIITGKWRIRSKLTPLVRS
jgi:hypothetical protein